VTRHAGLFKVQTDLLNLIAFLYFGKNFSLFKINAVNGNFILLIQENLIQVPGVMQLMGDLVKESLFF
jgi:hypothetical protein